MLLIMHWRLPSIPIPAWERLSHPFTCLHQECLMIIMLGVICIRLQEMECYSITMARSSHYRKTNSKAWYWSWHGTVQRLRFRPLELQDILPACITFMTVSSIGHVQNCSPIKVTSFLSCLQEVPKEISQLSNLTSLNVEDNLIHTIPSAVLRRCQALHTIKLRNNPITIEVCAWFWKASWMTHEDSL